MSGSDPPSSRGTAPSSAIHTQAYVQLQELHCDDIKNNTIKPCAEADLFISVIVVDDDVEDLEVGSNGVDHLQRHISLQNPIIQPAQVTAETSRQTRKKQALQLIEIET